MGKNSPHAWSITKAGPEPLLRRGKTEYPQHKRAEQTYSQWMAVYSEEEIADFFGIELEEVLRDIQHIHQVLPTRTVIAHLNARNRILIQRAEQARYRQLLSEALATLVEDYLQAGVSPTGPLKEYREATGMTSKPEPLIQVNPQDNYVGGTPIGDNPRSAADAIRRVLAHMAGAERRATASRDEQAGLKTERAVEPDSLPIGGNSDCKPQDERQFPTLR
jgi:hypothetical protein